MTTATRAAEPPPEPKVAPPAAGKRRRLTGGESAFPLAILFGLTLMDQMDQSAFSVLVPNVRDAFGMSDQGILTIVAIAAASALILTVPIALMADRYNRVAIMLAGAFAWACFSVGTGLAGFAVLLAVMRSGAAIGQAVVFPTHNSLMADWYPVDSRPHVYSIHRAAYSVGVILGVLIGAGLADAFSWRAPFIVFAVPTLIIVAIGLRLHEPERGTFERAEMGANAEVVEAVEPPPSYAEAYRMVWKIGALRRIFVALPFLAASIAGFTSLASIQYDRTFHLDVTTRAFLTAPAALFEIGGLVLGAWWATRLARRSPALVFRLLTWAGLSAAAFGALFAMAPTTWLAFIGNAGIVASLAVVGPGVLASLSLAIPARARSIGFSIGALFILPGLIVIPIIGGVGDAIGIRYGMLLLTPVFVIGAAIISTVGKVIDNDIRNVWTSGVTRAELFLERSKGNLALLLVRKLDVSYDDVQVLFGVDIDIREQEIVALLGTNGAGKSTLLRAITGVAEAHNGAVVFDGRDTTHLPPDEVARLGVAAMPGGEGVFPSLSVEENLRTAAWLERRHPDRVAERIAEVFELFPVLQDRRGAAAADLSGGQQQMLALGMALLARPKLLLIDELTLGLAPAVVGELLEVVRTIRDRGTAVLLVEQSVNVALELADRAYFMEKGEIRFAGPTRDLLDRPDVLRSVFLKGAAQTLGTGKGDGEAAGPGQVERPADQPVPRPHTRPAATATAEAGELAATRGAGNGFASGPVLATEGLAVSFGGVAAVRGVDLSCAPGEVLGIIGPNGAGKTTLFDLVSGFVRPDRGKVLLGGVDVTRRPPSSRARLGLGRSFQDSRLFPSLTVEETLSLALDRWIDVGDPLNAALHSPAHVETEAAVSARVDELIDLMGIESFRTKFVRELSTGSRRLVDLACVLALGPKVVLLDEPSSGIAQRETEALGPLLMRIRDHLDATLLVVEHDMALVTSIADRLVALDQGAVVADGPAEAVLDDPAVVSAYLGERDLPARSDHASQATQGALP